VEEWVTRQSVVFGPDVVDLARIAVWRAKVGRELSEGWLREGAAEEWRQCLAALARRLEEPRAPGHVLRNPTPPKVGDVVEIPTPEGFAYAQYTHAHPGLGELLRVLPGLFDNRPADFAPLVEHKERFWTFHALRYTIRRRELAIVAHQPVPEWARHFPRFR